MFIISRGMWVLLFFLYANVAHSAIPLPIPKTPKHIAIMQIIEHPALTSTRRGIEDELRTQDTKIDFESAQGNPALAAQIAQKFVGASPDVMVGIGTTAAQALISAQPQGTIPIVFSSITDPLEARLVKNLKNPGGIVTGVSNFVDPTLQFELFKKIVPTLSRIGVIYNPGEANSVMLIEQMKKIASLKKIILVLTTANTTADVPLATRSLIGKVQAIFINNDNTALSAFDSIVKIATQHKIPVFCSDTDMVNRGALAALGPNQYEVGRQTGKMIIAILQGKTPQQLPVQFPDKVELRLNLKQATKLGLTIPTPIINEATTDSIEIKQ